MQVTRSTLPLCRYNVDGSLDTSFGSGGVVSLPTVSSVNNLLNAVSVAVQSDGKLVIATNTTTYTYAAPYYTVTSESMMVLRLNTNGSLDTSFGKGGETIIPIPNASFETTGGVAVLPGGQIVVAGTNVYTYAGPEFVVARLTAAGALDPSFGPNGQGYNDLTVSSGQTSQLDGVDTLAVDASGNILIGGYTTDSSGSIYTCQVVRYTPSGLLDTSFANQGDFDVVNTAGTQGVHDIAFQPDGHIILGLVAVHTPGGGKPSILRLNTDGSIDTTFGSNGYFIETNGGAYDAVAVQSDGKILFEGTYGATPYKVLVDRLLPGGALDPSFGTGGTTEFVPQSPNVGSPKGLLVGPDGKITGVEQSDTASGFPEIGTFRLLNDPPVTGQLVVTQQPPSSLAAGTPFGLTVDAEDSSGNIETSFNGTVTVALANNPGGATLGGTLTATASNGVATFSGLTLTTAASGYTLVVYSTGLSEAVTSAIAVTPLTASQVGITQQPPSSVTAGSGFGLQAAIEDQYGNVVTTASGTVTVALANNPGGATLGGTLTATTSQGVATFSGLTLTTASTGYTLAVSSSGLSGSTSSAITVTPAAATQLAITQQPPASVVVNGTFGLIVVVEDTYGNVVTSASNKVKVAFKNNPTRARSWAARSPRRQAAGWRHSRASPSTRWVPVTHFSSPPAAWPAWSQTPSP